jgi:hypothetical protein
MILARTTLPLLAALTSFAAGCAVGGGTDDASRSTSAKNEQQVGPAANPQAIAQREPSASIRNVSLYDVTQAFRNVLGIHHDETFLKATIWAQDETARSAIQVQHLQLAHVAQDGHALVRAQEDLLARGAGEAFRLGAETEATIAVIAGLSDPYERTSLQFFLDANTSAFKRSTAMGDYMTAVEGARLEGRLEALHSLLVDDGYLRTFARGVTEAYPMKQGERGLAMLELRFASLVATEIRGARALAAAYAFDAAIHPARAYEAQVAISKLETTLSARLKQQGAAYLEAAAVAEIQLGHDARMAEPDRSGAYDTSAWLSTWLGRASLVGHVTRDATQPVSEEESVLHVAFLARGVDEKVVTLRGELTHPEGTRVCLGVGDCASWTWNGEVRTVPFDAKVKARALNVPELVGQYGYLNAQADGVHLSRSNAWSLIEGTVAIPRGTHGELNNETAWLQWSTDGFNSARVQLVPEAAPGMFMAGHDLRYHGRSMQLGQFPWAVETRGNAQFLSKANVLSTGKVQTRVENVDNAALAEQSATLPLTLDSGMGQVQIFGNWSADRRLIGGTKADGGVSVDCATSTAALASTQSQSGVFLNHTRLAGDASFGVAQMCSRTDTILASSMQAASTNFEGVHATYNETFYRDTTLQGSASLTLTSGVVSSAASPYYASDAVSLSSFIVLIK